MSEQPNTVETTQEPTLDQFNEAPTATAKPVAEATPAPEQPAPATQTTEQPSAPAAAQPAAATEADPYAGVLDGLQGADQYLFDGLMEVAKHYNMPKEAVRALTQLDIANTKAQQIAEDKLLAEAQTRWAQECHAKYGDNLKNVETNCSRVLAELDKDGKFKELLATAGVQGHPATLGFLKTIGDLYLEKSSVNPNATVSTDEEVELENFN